MVGVASLVIGMALTMFARRFRGVNRLRTAE